MLKEIVPKKFPRIVALPVLGQVADDYDTWLSQQGYGQTPDADTRGRWSESIGISGAAGIDSGRAFGRPISKRA